MSSRHRDWDIACKVYIGNLGNNASKYELEDAFSKYGPLKNVWVARNPPGFAFVEFEDPRDAEDSVRGLDGTRMCGVSIDITVFFCDGRSSQICYPLLFQQRVRVEMSNGQSRGGRGGRDRDRRGFGSRGLRRRWVQLMTGKDVSHCQRFLVSVAAALDLAAGTAAAVAAAPRRTARCLAHALVPDRRAGGGDVLARDQDPSEQEPHQLFFPSCFHHVLLVLEQKRQTCLNVSFSLQVSSPSTASRSSLFRCARSSPFLKERNRRLFSDHFVVLGVLVLSH